MTLTPKPGVLDIDVYVPGRSQAAGAARVHKLSSNESPFGPSPASIAAYEGARQQPPGREHPRPESYDQCRRHDWAQQPPRTARSHGHRDEPGPQRAEPHG